MNYKTPIKGGEREERKGSGRGKEGKREREGRGEEREKDREGEERGEVKSDWDRKGHGEKKRTVMHYPPEDGYFASTYMIKGIVHSILNR